MTIPESSAPRSRLESSADNLVHSAAIFGTALDDARIRHPRLPPAPDYGIHEIGYHTAGFMPICASREKTVVLSFGVTDMGQHREIYRGAIEVLGPGGSTNPVAVLPTGMLSDGALSPGRAPRISPPHFLRESLQVLAIRCLRFLLANPRPGCARRRIRDAGGLGGLQRLLLDQKALAFVAISGSTPFQHDGPKARCLLGTPGERGISGRKKLEVVEVRTGQTQGSFGLIQANPGGASQRRSTLAARTLPARNEDLDFRSTVHGDRHSM